MTTPTEPPVTVERGPDGGTDHEELPLPPAAPDLDAVPHALRVALASGDSQTARTIALSALASGTSLENFYEHLVRPVLEEIGSQWQQGTLSIGEEHIYTTTIRTLIDRLGDLPVPPATRGRVVLLRPPGEQHLLGLLMLRNVLRKRGWNVSAPDPLPVEGLVDLVHTLGDVVAVGMSLHRCRDHGTMREKVAYFRQELPNVPLVLGGLALRRDPTLWRRVGACGAAEDLPGALALIDTVTNPLTGRERDILVMTSYGATNDEIAQQLAVKPSTVKTHLERIYTKLGVRDRPSSVALALRRKWID